MSPFSKRTKDHYAAADSWARDRREELHRSRRIAWILAAVAAAVALLEGIALIVLTPLKTVVPYTLLVDRQTGAVQALQPLDQQRIAPDTALTQSLLVQYVAAREGYDADAVRGDYRKVALWSAGTARASYLVAMQPASGVGPTSLYPRSTVVSVDIRSVSAIARNVAMVRFDTIRSDAGREGLRTGSWVSIIRYAFSGEPLRAQDRYLNPLGFKVQRYSRTPETLPTPLASETFAADVAGTPQR